MSVSDNDALQLLKSHMPGGMERWQNITSSGYIGKLWTALAQSVKLYGYDVLDTLRNELRAASMTERLPDWEEATGLASSRVALIGTAAQRRGQIVSRRREYGASTLPDIKGALAAVCGVEPTILEHSRAILDVLIGGGFAAPGDPISAGPGTNTWTLVLADNAPCSQAGARLYVQVDHAAVSDLTIRLTAPDATYKEWPGSEFTSTVQRLVWWQAAAGKTITGTWTLRIANAGATAGTLEVSTLRVEGIGRASYFSTTEGLGSRAFEWSAFIDETLASSAYDRGAALAIVDRWNQAHLNGGIAIAQAGGVQGAICGDPNCIAGIVVVG